MISFDGRYETESGRKHVKVTIRLSDFKRVGDLVKKDSDSTTYIIIKLKKDSDDKIIVTLKPIDDSRQNVFDLTEKTYHEKYHRPGNTFTVYRSLSQGARRFCYMKNGKYYEKGRYYTSTTVVHPHLQELLEKNYLKIPEVEWDEVYVPMSDVFERHVNNEKRVDDDNILYKLCSDESLPFLDEVTLMKWMQKTTLDIKLSDCFATQPRTKKILISLNHTLSRKLSLRNKNINDLFEKYQYKDIYNGTIFTFYIRTLSDIKIKSKTGTDPVKTVKYTYLITSGDDSNMTPWGMPEKYVPAGILLLKPFEYKRQAESAVTVTVGESWRDGMKYKVNKTLMSEYYFFGDVTSGIFPTANMAMFDSVHNI